ncbi:aconitate hydratase AcnA [candidate division KSB1 bacterium]|nr:aconitate hydratase AcnA [candidate division KSB1 bacterium]
MKHANSFGARGGLIVGDVQPVIFNLNILAKQLGVDIDRLPFSIKVLLESLLRNEDGELITADDIETLARWNPAHITPKELPFKPSRVVMQDFTGVPAVVDLAALRSTAVRLGGNPRKINPQIPVVLVIDHSVQVDRFASKNALDYNSEREFERNRERYEFLKWAANTFDNFRVVPPATGIVHQVNLEYLASVVQQTATETGEIIAYPDSLVGTDSHTTMINGIGVIGWGVGGIEAEAAMLGQPIYMLTPEVIGFKLTGEMPEAATATDLVLTITQILREKGVVGKFVEFCGPGLNRLTLPDRATIANMAPEYGATMGFFPVDSETLNYLRQTGRSEEQIKLVEIYTQEQGLFRTAQSPIPRFTDLLELDMSTVEPTLAGPRRPQDRVPLKHIKESWRRALTTPPSQRGFGLSESDLEKAVTVSKNATSDVAFELKNGSVVIAAITSCTNTSNPAVMIAAGLLAKKAVELGLTRKPWVKTSLAPGSTVVTRYLRESGLMPYLEALGFHTVGYGCTTCIGNSGSLPPQISSAINANKLLGVAVLSGNRNFEGRISPDVQANYLASPPLVVAYALAGTIDIDLLNEPLATDPNGQSVYLRDILPTKTAIQAVIDQFVNANLFTEQYKYVWTGNSTWNTIPVPTGERFRWNPESSYIQQPPFFEDLTLVAPEPGDIRNANVLAWLPDSTTTDHISPAGAIAPDSPAGRYLIEKNVQPADFNSYGSRRGNHEVMMRGTLANIRIKNRLLPGVEGGYTRFHPTGEQVAIWDAASKYMEAGIPLIILAGKEYGTGSSRDWAAKGVFLQGVKAILAESYERIHRSNLVGIGVLPLQFKPGSSADSLGLTGTETYTILNSQHALQPGSELTVQVTNEQTGNTFEFPVDCRLETEKEAEYFRHGGILNAILRDQLRK